MVRKFLSTYKVVIFLSFILGAVYLLTRVLTLSNLPIFTDEAIYLRWAQIAGNDASWRFISLTDGKQPLFIWFIIPLLRLVDDPLIAGRFVSVIAGFLSMIGMFFLGKEVFKNYRIGFLCSFLYLISPFSFVYDRMALYDALVGTFTIWSLYIALIFTRTLRLDAALILGGTIGMSVLNKSNGFFNLLLLPFLFPLLPIQKGKWTGLYKWIGLGILIGIISYGMYSLLRLSPFFYIIELKNTTFIYPFSEWIQHPFASFIFNFRLLSTWFISYMNIPFLLLIVLAFFIDKRFLREKIVLLLWFLVPFIILCFFGKAIYPRYIFPMSLTLLPLIAFSFFFLYRKLEKQKPIFFCLSVLVFAFPLFTDYRIITDFLHSAIPESDRGQYLRDWPAGGGVKESVWFFKEQAKNGKIYIGTQGTFGLLPFAYELYFTKEKNIMIDGYWPIPEVIPEKILTMAEKMPTYVVFYQPCVTCAREGEAPKLWPVKKISEYIRPGAISRLTVYQVIKP